MPGMDGTGTLFGAFETELRRRGATARIVAYPSDEPLGYRDLEAHLEVGDGSVIVAESFSGPLAIRLAAAHPRRVKALVLVASFARDPTRVAARLGGLLGSLAFRLRPPRWVLRWALAGPDAPDDVLTELASAMAMVSPAVLARRLRAIASIDVRDELARCRVPLAYLGGTRDRMIRPRVAAEIARLRPDVEVRWLDAPHLVLQRRAAEAAEVVTEIAARWQPPPARRGAALDTV